MTAFNDQWQRFDQRARIGLVLGAALIIMATIALGTWTLRTDYQVLFADLGPQDAATMVAELDLMKTPYRLSGGGNTILVPADMVYKTRLKLVGKELPLRGAVGFELFNNSEVGMTEFAQKVNYQRALQGEITRTILSLDEVQSVRVHLVLSEQALFKKNGTQPKASITIAPKPGKSLDAGQVQGIQRLVSAAVPDIKPNDVTILDQHGNALTRRKRAEGEETSETTDGLDEKRAIEAYLNKKVVAVLDRMFGAGQGIASVDVTLKHEQTKVTTENVLGTNPEDKGPATGVVIRERETSRDANVETNVSGIAPSTPANNGVISREVDYQVGRRVEQIASSGGAISRVNVAVVVRKILDQTQLDRLKDVVALAAGINKTRGDAVAVYSVDQIASAPASSAANKLSFDLGQPDMGTDGALVLPNTPETSTATTATSPPPALKHIVTPWEILAGMLVLAVPTLLVFAWRVAARREERRQLSAPERDKLLAQVNVWLENSTQQPVERS